MSYSDHSKARPTQIWGSHDFCIIFSCLGEAKVSCVNSDLTNLVDVQRLHENIK